MSDSDKDIVLVWAFSCAIFLVIGLAREQQYRGQRLYYRDPEADRRALQ